MVGPPNSENAVQVTETDVSQNNLPHRRLAVDTEKNISQCTTTQTGLTCSAEMSQSEKHQDGSALHNNKQKAAANN